MEDVLAGLATAITPVNLLFVFIGVVLGMIIGIMPGLGPTATVALLLPFTLEMGPSTAIIMLAGVYYGSMYGGTITSVMLRVPGEAASVVTTLDGYPMAKQGRAASALGISAIGSLVGGLVAVVGIALLAPQLAQFAVSLGAPGLAALGVLGLVLVSYVGTRSTVKSLGMAAVGLLLATIGLDPFDGSIRANFGFIELRSGIDIVILTVGLLGIAELVKQVTKKRAGLVPPEKLAAVGSRVLPTRADLHQSAGAIGRGSVIGFILGLVPGGGGIMSSLGSYALERRIAKDPSRFGKGAIEGVAGPETANNAASQSAFIPLMTLGLPPNSVLAVIYGALLLHGITPGPGLITNHGDIFWGVVISMVVGNIILVLLNLFLIRWWVRVIDIPMGYLAPVALAVILISCYTISFSAFEVGLAVFFGIVGVLLHKVGLEPAPLILGYVLGGILEVNVRRSLIISDGSASIFFTDPVAAAVFAVILALFIAKAAATFRGRWAARRLADQPQPADTRGVVTPDAIVDTEFVPATDADLASTPHGPPVFESARGESSGPEGPGNATPQLAKDGRAEP